MSATVAGGPSSSMAVSGPSAGVKGGELDGGHRYLQGVAGQDLSSTNTDTHCRLGTWGGASAAVPDDAPQAGTWTSCTRCLRSD
jgi:hypothetical protein